MQSRTGTNKIAYLPDFKIVNAELRTTALTSYASCLLTGNGGFPAVDLTLLNTPSLPVLPATRVSFLNPSYVHVSKQILPVKRPLGKIVCSPQYINIVIVLQLVGGSEFMTFFFHQ